ncbi:MAG: hypothetical protein I8H75_01670 [Myxococcaceae bacterium]|nr:hypothetical protein [Myxococcaceae bacterium]MBH2006048.1 hypothetical protein [Myxococcaceae bacterium]
MANQVFWELSKKFKRPLTALGVIPLWVCFSISLSSPAEVVNPFALTPFFTLPHWHGETCSYLPTDGTTELVLPANLMCRGNEPGCYEPPQSLEVGIALLNGFFKGFKSGAKYLGKNDIAALMGAFNAMGDFSILFLKDRANLREGTIFALRLAREGARAVTGTTIQRIGSLEDLSSHRRVRISIPSAELSKAALKVPLILEKQLDWGNAETDWEVWLLSSAPGLLLALTEHYARYYKLPTLRPMAGFGLTIAETASFLSMCPTEPSFYKNSRQLARIGLHFGQCLSLFQNRDQAPSQRFKLFTLFTMLEHIGVAVADSLYYKWNP